MRTPERRPARQPSTPVQVPPLPPHRYEPPADTCRRLGWTVGDRLRGDEGYGPTTITITAIGEKRILARADGQDERDWVLWCRPWQKIGTAPTAGEDGDVHAR